MLHVFVYGTLLPGQSNYGVAEPFVLAAAPGAVRGRLYDVGPYPAVVLDPAGPLVYGEWLTLDDRALPLLDELEDYCGPDGPNEYERVWEGDAEQPHLSGWIYVYRDNQGLPLIPSGSWRLHRQKKSGLKSE